MPNVSVVSAAISIGHGVLCSSWKVSGLMVKNTMERLGVTIELIFALGSACGKTKHGEPRTWTREKSLEISQELSKIIRVAL